MAKDSSVIIIKYYQNNKERLQKKVVKDQSLSNEEKEEKRQYGREQCTNSPEDDIQKLFEYHKKYTMRKKGLVIIIRNYFP